MAAIVQADGDDFVRVGDNRQKFDLVEAVIGTFARRGLCDDVERARGNGAAQGLRSTREGLRVDDAVVGDDAVGFRSVN